MKIETRIDANEGSDGCVDRFEMPKRQSVGVRVGVEWEGSGNSCTRWVRE